MGRTRAPILKGRAICLSKNKENNYFDEFIVYLQFVVVVYFSSFVLL